MGNTMYHLLRLKSLINLSCYKPNLGILKNTYLKTRNESRTKPRGVSKKYRVIGFWNLGLKKGVIGLGCLKFEC